MPTEHNAPATDQACGPGRGPSWFVLCVHLSPLASPTSPCPASPVWLPRPRRTLPPASPAQPPLPPLPPYFLPLLSLPRPRITPPPCRSITHAIRGEGLAAAERADSHGPVSNRHPTPAHHPSPLPPVRLSTSRKAFLTCLEPRARPRVSRAVNSRAGSVPSGAASTLTGLAADTEGDAG